MSSEQETHTRGVTYNTRGGEICYCEQCSEKVQEWVAWPCEAAQINTDGSANTCRHTSSSGVDRAPIGPGKVWACDHCGLRWTDTLRALLDAAPAGGAEDG